MSLGINMIYGPVFDVHLPPGGNMNLRAYGSKMAAVVKLGTSTSTTAPSVSIGTATRRRPVRSRPPYTARYGP